MVDAATNALDGVHMVPSVSRNRLGGMLSSRKEWCVSRQRSWGVPIPVFYDLDTYVQRPLLCVPRLGARSFVYPQGDL